MRPFCLDCGSEVCAYEDERVMVPNRLLDPATVADLRARWDAEVPSNAEVRSDPERLTAVISPGLLLRKHGEITDEGQG